MNSRTTAVTAQQLLQMADDGNRYEFVSGKLHMMSPAGGRHGRVAHNVGLVLGIHVRKEDLGVVFAAETGFLISRDPDTVRAPDVAFVSSARLTQLPEDTGYLELAPDLVGEVISPGDTFSEVEEKALGWLTAGTRMVLLVDPGTRTLHVYRSADNIVVFNDRAEVDASDVVPGWHFAVNELFR
jgi:Uma2 family endonuclease